MKRSTPLVLTCLLFGCASAGATILGGVAPPGSDPRQCAQTQARELGYSVADDNAYFLLMTRGTSDDDEEDHLHVHVTEDPATGARSLLQVVATKYEVDGSVRRSTEPTGEAQEDAAAIVAACTTGAGLDTRSTHDPDRSNVNQGERE